MKETHITGKLCYVFFCNLQVYMFSFALYHDRLHGGQRVFRKHFAKGNVFKM